MIKTERSEYMSILEKFLTATEDIWAEYNKHPFVKGIEDGTLDKAKFRHYLIQDYLYLIDYGKVFAIGMAKAKSAESRQKFSSYIRSISECEMDTHRGYMGIMGISHEEIENAKMSLDNLSYTSYMLRVAYEEGESEIVAAILSCAYSYEVIAKKILENNPKADQHPFYGDWVKSYAGEEYHADNVSLIEWMEKLAGDYEDEDAQHLVDIFVACSRYELDFWEMAWGLKK